MLRAHFIAKKSSFAADSYTFSAGKRLRHGMSKGLRTGLQGSVINGSSKLLLLSSGVSSGEHFSLSRAASSELVTSSSFNGVLTVRFSMEGCDVGLLYRPKVQNISENTMRKRQQERRRKVSKGRRYHTHQVLQVLTRRVSGRSPTSLDRDNSDEDSVRRLPTIHLSSFPELADVMEE